MKQIDYVMKRNMIKLFLRESNAVEGVYSDDAFNRALKAFTYLKKFDVLTLENILQCHKMIMWKLDKSVAGKLRTYNVHVGGDLKLDHKGVEHHLQKWIKLASPASNSLGFYGFASIKKSHVEFENIHPFGDGNGRIGRLIMLWQGVKTKTRIPVIYEKDKQHYYKWFINEEEEKRKRCDEALSLFKLLTKERKKRGLIASDVI